MKKLVLSNVASNTFLHILVCQGLKISDKNKLKFKTLKEFSVFGLGYSVTGEACLTPDGQGDQCIC